MQTSSARWSDDCHPKVAHFRNHRNFEMSSKDKKVKSSKAEDKKLQKKGDEITIIVDRSNAESAASPVKNDIDQGDNPATRSDEQVIDHTLTDDVNIALEKHENGEVEKPLSDATKLTEILVERWANMYYYGKKQCWD